MSGEPTLGVITKVQLGVFAKELQDKYPDQRRAIASLQDTLETRLAQNPQMQNEIIRKLNADTRGTIDNARKMIEKDPGILARINQDPTKLATLMGVKVPAPAAAPATAAKTAAAKTEPTKAEPLAVAATAAPAAKAAVTTPAAAAAPSASAVTKPISDQDMALREAIATESQKVAAMKGFDELAARAAQSDTLSHAIDALTGSKGASQQDQLKALKELQQDPDFFVKANAAIDEIPEQARDSAFTEIANNPELGKRALAGDAAAKSELQSNTMKGLFSGGPDGKGGLAGLFQGDVLKNIGELFKKIIPMLMDMMKGFAGKLMGGLQNMASSSGLMRDGNYPEGTASVGQKIAQSLGMDNKNTPVIDAAKPGEPAVPLSKLGAPQPGSTQPGPTQPGPTQPGLQPPAPGSREFEQRAPALNPGSFA